MPDLWRTLCLYSFFHSYSINYYHHEKNIQEVEQHPFIIYHRDDCRLLCLWTTTTFVASFSLAFLRNFFFLSWTGSVFLIMISLKFSFRLLVSTMISYSNPGVSNARSLHQFARCWVSSLVFFPKSKHDRPLFERFSTDKAPWNNGSTSLKN